MTWHNTSWHDMARTACRGADGSLSVTATATTMARTTSDDGNDTAALGTILKTTS